MVLDLSCDLWDVLTIVIVQVCVWPVMGVPLRLMSKRSSCFLEIKDFTWFLVELLRFVLLRLGYKCLLGYRVLGLGHFVENRVVSNMGVWGNWTSRSICLHWNRSMYGPCCWNWGSKSLRGMGGHAGCRKSCILCLWSLCPFVSFGKKELGFCLAFQSTRYLFWKYNIVFFFGSKSMFKEFCWIWMHQRKIQDI